MELVWVGGAAGDEAEVEVEGGAATAAEEVGCGVSGCFGVWMITIDTEEDDGMEDTLGGAGLGFGA